MGTDSMVMITSGTNPVSDTVNSNLSDNVYTFQIVDFVCLYKIIAMKWEKVTSYYFPFKQGS